MQINEKYLNDMEEKVFTEGLELNREGKKIVGVYCAFTPTEIIAAAGAIPVSLCASSQESIVTAEKDLPKNLCPLIKSSYGHAIESSCPYFALSDFIFADTTCDGKKKMFEMLNNIKPVYPLILPQTSETEESIKWWERELYKIKNILEEKIGCNITEEDLKKQIKLYNEYKKVTGDVYRLNTGEVPLLNAREIFYILDGIGFECNLDKRIEEIRKAIEVIKEREKDEEYLNSVKGKPRILVTGCPSTNKKLLEIIEESNGIVVAMENCGGLKTCGLLVDENKDPMRALAESYVKVPCPCMTPNNRRLDLIEEIIKDYKIDGVVELTWQACHTYNVEAYSVKKHVTDKCNTPYIQIETDYNENDRGQLKVRIEAFLEMLI